jgi:hypothetical protein
MKHTCILWCAATTLAMAILAGCDPISLAPSGPVGGTAYGDEEWTILLMTFWGPTHIELSEQFTRNTETRTGWKNLRTIHKEGTSEMQWGRYRSVKEAQGDLKRAHQFKAPASGELLYAKAMVIPLPGARVGPPEWDLAMTKTGDISVQVAVFFDVPEQNYVGRKRFAVEYCKQLRDDGYEAYYFHGAARSAVAVGLFPAKAVHKRPNTNPVQYEILDPKMRQIMVKFPKLAVNGREELMTMIDPNTARMENGAVTGKYVKVPVETSPFIIPRQGVRNPLEEPAPAEERPFPTTRPTRTGNNVNPNYRPGNP